MTTAAGQKLITNLVATGIAVCAVVCVIVVAAAVFLNGRELWTVAGAVSLFTVPFSVAAWHGRYKEKSGERKTPITFRGWRNMFLASAVLSAIFVGIDIIIVHPGLSLAMTVGALGSALVALGGFIRAWIRRQMLARQKQKWTDA